MENSKIGWCILILALFLTTYGIFWCSTVLISIILFLIGLLSLLYIQQGDVEKFFQKCAGNPLVVTDIGSGFEHLVALVQNPTRLPKNDRRVTGSELIDSSLQEILGYVLRDYVVPWYSLISTDREFLDVTVRKTSQTLAINISNKVKEVDWIPYLTTRLVDDAATHLRLFKQARFKLDQNNKLKMLRDQKASPVKRPVHKRNKSEADVVQCSESGNSKFYVPDLNRSTLEDYFFELECQMENNTVCRECVCKDSKQEKEFLSELVELLLYILLPDGDFQCKSLRFVLRDIFSAAVILPVFSMISNPDFINQMIIWLCARDNSLPSDTFLTTLRFTDNCDELKYTKELVAKEIQQLRSRDSGGESDISIKQQLSSLFYVNKLIDNRLAKLQNSGPTDKCINEYDKKLENAKQIKLPLEFVLKNNVALSYFIDYVTSTDLHTYLFFYLNIEGWKVSVEQQLSDIHIKQIKNVNNEDISVVYDNIRSTALSIYDQYLGEKSQQKVQLKLSLVQTLYFRIRNLTQPPSEQWFDEIQMALYEILESNEEFLPSFHCSTPYIKLLAELDLIQQNLEEDTLSLNNLDTTDDDKQMPVQNLLTVPNLPKANKHVRSLSDITTFTSDEVTNNENHSTQAPAPPRQEKQSNEDLRVGEFTLAVEIIETGIVSEKGKTFGVYAIHVSRQYESGFSENWHIYRRYSDFHDLHSKIKDKFPSLSKMPFPGKKTFHNMDRVVLERRMRMLGSYLQQLCRLCILSSYASLRNLLMTFLEQGDYDRATGGAISNTIDTIVNPFKSGMKSIKSMPEQIINTMDEVVEGISKVFQGKSNRIPEASKVGASLDIETDDNIPFRIILLLMDEIFDLKSRNQWLRRRIVTLLRQIVRTMFGDIVNRRIVDYVSYITSPKNVAQYLHNFKHSFWPNGAKVDKFAERDQATCSRTRVAAKTALLSWLSDDLKHIIGSETTRCGILTVFELFQRPVLNRRLLYVLVEGVIVSLFPEKDMSVIFQKLHAKSKSTTHCDIKKNK